MRHRHDPDHGLTARDVATLRQVAAASLTPGTEELARLAGLTRPDPAPAPARPAGPARKRGRR